MQTQSNDAPSISLSVGMFASSSEAIRDIKKAIGPEIFKRAQVALHDVIYDLAKEKNSELLDKLFNHNTSVLLIEKEQQIEQAVALFSAANPIDGISPSYYIAQRASQNKELEVLDFLIEKFTAHIHLFDMVTALAVNNDHAAIARLEQIHRQSPRFQTFKMAIMFAYHFSGHHQELANFRARTNDVGPLDFGHPAAPYQLDTIDKQFALKALYFFWEAKHKKETISLSTLKIRFGYAIEKSLSNENQWLHTMLARYNQHHLVKEIMMQLMRMDLPFEQQRKHFQTFVIGAAYGGCYNTLSVLLALGVNFREMMIATVKAGYLLQPYKLLQISKHAAYLKKTPSKPSQAVTVSAHQVASMRENLIKYLKLACDVIGDREKVQQSSDLFFAPQGKESSNNIPGTRKYVSTKYIQDVYDKHPVLHKNRKMAVETFILAVLEITQPRNVSKLNEMKEIFTTFLALLTNPNDHCDLWELINKPLSKYLPSHPFSLDASFIQYILCSSTLHFMHLFLLLEYVPHIMDMAWPTVLTDPIKLNSPEGGEGTLTTPLYILTMDADLATALIQVCPRLTKTLDPHHLFAEFFRDETDANIKIESVHSPAYRFLLASEKSADFFIKSFGDSLKHHINNPFILFLLIQRNAGKEWLKKNVLLLKNISHRVYKFADIGQFFVSHPELAQLIVKDNTLMNAFPAAYQRQFLQIKKEQQEKEEQIKQANKKMCAAKKVDSKAENQGNPLVRELENRGYKQGRDFSITSKDKTYLLYFKAQSNTLSAFVKIFKNKKMNPIFLTGKGNIHELSLSFSQAQLNHVVDIIKTNDALEKQEGHKGCIQNKQEQASLPIHASPVATDVNNEKTKNIAVAQPDNHANQTENITIPDEREESMQTRQRDEKDSIILKAIEQAKQTLGEEVFKRASTDLDQFVYELAEEKNEQLLSQLLNFHIIVSPKITNQREIKQMLLFDLTRYVNGIQPLYRIAKRASRENKWEILDCILTVCTNLKKRDILRAYREDNNHEQLNLLLAKHVIDESEFDLEHEKYLALKKELAADLSDKGVDFDEIFSYCEKEKDISIEKLTTRFNYGLGTTNKTEMLIYVALAVYNHHAVLKKIMASLFNTHIDLQSATECADTCLKAAMIGGSYETICIILVFTGRLFEAVQLAFEQKDILLLSKLITLSHHTNYYIKTPPLTNAAPATPTKEQEISAKHNLMKAIQILVSVIDTLKDLSGRKNVKGAAIALSTYGKHFIATIRKDELEKFVEQISCNFTLDQSFKTKTYLLREMLSAWLYLFNDETNSLGDLLNKPMDELFKKTVISPIEHYKLNLFQCITHCDYKEYLYLRFILFLTTDFLPFVSPNTINENAYIQPAGDAEVEFSVINCLAINETYGVDILIKHPMLLDGVPTDFIFKEIYLPQDDLEIKVNNIDSLANNFLQFNKKAAAFFLKKYDAQMKAHIDNPFLLFHLLRNSAGITWLMSNIQLLKNISQTTYQFADIMQCIASHPNLAALIAKDTTLLAIFPESYQNQMKMHHEKAEAENKKIKAENKKISQLSKKVEQPKLNHDETALIQAIETQGYLREEDDVSVRHQDKQYEIIFATKGNDTLTAIKTQFKKLHHVTLTETNKGQIHQLSLCFPDARLPNIIETFKARHELKKKPQYQGCVKEALTIATPKKPVDDHTSDAKKEGIQQENWLQAIRDLFCNATITIEVDTRKKISFTVNYPDTGKTWLLQESAAKKPKHLFVTDNHIKQLFIASLMTDFKKHALIKIEKINKQGKNKIVITPISNTPPDVSALQSKHFNIIYEQHQARLPFIYGIKASKKLKVSDDRKLIFKEFEDACKKHKIDAKFLEKDSTFLSKEVSNDRDFVTTCTSVNVFEEMGLKHNKKAKNLTIGTLFSGTIAGKRVDVLSISDHAAWATYAAESADVTGCSVCIAHHTDGKFYALDPLGRGLADIDINKIVPTSFEDLQNTLQQDPIRIIRAIKFQIRGNDIDARYEAAIMDWQPAEKMDVTQFSIKLHDEMKKMTSQINASDPFVLKWIGHLRKYQLLEKVYQQDDTISDGAILVTIRGHLPYQTQLQPVFFKPKPQHAEGASSPKIIALEQSVTEEEPCNKPSMQPGKHTSPF